MFAKMIALLLVLLMTLPANSAASARNLEVVFLEAGKADAIVLMTEKSTVLIDTGKNKMGDEIVSYLQSRGIERLEIMIITHFDKDHVGGADKVLEAFPVDMVYEPNYDSDSNQFLQYKEALLNAPETGLLSLAQNIAFELDGVQYFIDVANRNYYGEDEENDFSLVTSAQYGQIRFLFAGDAENDRLGELLQEGDLTHDVLKIPHHGVAEELSATFFQAVNPRYAVITSDEKNLEDASVVYALETQGTEVYLTRQGAITFTTDGANIFIRQNAPK